MNSRAESKYTLLRVQHPRLNFCSLDINQRGAPAQRLTASLPNVVLGREAVAGWGRIRIAVHFTVFQSQILLRLRQRDISRAG